MSREKAAARLEKAGATWREAKTDERRAMREVYAAITVAVAAGIPETEAARLAGIDRMTVRKALGKR